MEHVIPWPALIEVIEPHYPKGERGRPPIALKRMLRVYCVQQWFGLSDEGVEDAVTDSRAVTAFVGIDLGRERAPDATTLLQFRHLLEKHDLPRVFVRDDQPHPGGAGSDDARRDDCGCDHHCRSAFGKE
jgi:IS5 family transposase